MARPPLIGIILDEAPGGAGAFSRHPHYALRKHYFEGVEAAGAIGVGVSYSIPSFEGLLDICDGWLIPGGDYRFDPAWYVNAPPADVMIPTDRMRFEIYATRRLIERNAPLLGVCNGMQVMAGVMGGRMRYRSSDQHGDVAHYAPDGVALHSVSIEPGSRLHDALGAATLIVNSSHKEHVVSAGDGVVVTARARDGGLEAIELPANDFALGVQWHPELDSGQAGARLFQAFVAAARRQS
jgi:putative glutamine amidotransferase